MLRLVRLDYIPSPQLTVGGERWAAPGVGEVSAWALSRGSPATIDASPVIRAVVADLRRGVDREVISARFHNTIADIVAKTSAAIRESTGVDKVALSGGVFQNRILLRKAMTLLESGGFEVFTHRQGPTNDGCISLGQGAGADCGVAA